MVKGAIMDYFDLIDNRATCRFFSDEPIPDDVLNRLLDAAAKAPSGGGFQNTSVIVVTDQDKKDRLAQLSRNQSFIAKAPINLIFCLDHRRTWLISQHEYAPKAPLVDFFELLLGVVDTSLSAHTLCLAAEAMGLRSCYNGNVIQQCDELCEMLSIPKYVVPVVMLTIGYPKGKSVVSNKFDYSFMTNYNEYKDSNIEQLYEAYRIKTSNQHSKITPDKVEQIRKNAEKLYGKEWADECVKRISNQDELTSFQYWLGCFYSNKAGDMTAEDYKEFFIKQGFEFA